jgi:hypothetical protein
MNKQTKVVDAELYEKLSKPFSSEDKAKRNLDGFWNELRAIRKKYKIPNVVVIYEYTYKDEADRVMIGSNYGHCGDSTIVLPLLQLAYERQYQAETQLTQVNLHESVVLLLVTCGFGNLSKMRDFVKNGNVKIDGEVITEDCSLPDNGVLSIRNPDTGQWEEFPIAGKQNEDDL